MPLPDGPTGREVGAKIPKRYADRAGMSMIRMRRWMPWITPEDWDRAEVPVRQAWLDAVLVLETEQARRDKALAEMIAHEVGKVVAGMWGK